jgi:hypothetical protein
MMTTYVPLRATKRAERFIMLHTSRRTADRANRLASAAVICCTTGKVCPADWLGNTAFRAIQESVGIMATRHAVRLLPTLIFYPLL